MQMIGFRCLARSHTAPPSVPGGPIPDDFWVVWEGHPISLGDGSKCRRGKGLKTIYLGPTRTTVTCLLVVTAVLFPCFSSGHNNLFL